MTHNFDTEVAEKYGLIESILLNYIYYWVEKNQANGTNFYDGVYWTYNSTRAFNKLFPYVSERQIKNALKHLREEEIVLSGNYNKSSYDRTLWYALTKKGYSIVQKCPMDDAKKSNGKDDNAQSFEQIETIESTNEVNPLGKDVRPIPVNKPNNKTDELPINNYSAQGEKKSLAEQESSVAISLPLNTGEGYPVSNEKINEFNELYPAVDILQAMRSMKGWLNANPTKRKTLRGINRFINSWLAREQDKGGTRSVGNGVQITSAKDPLREMIEGGYFDEHDRNR